MTGDDPNIDPSVSSTERREAESDGDPPVACTLTEAQRAERSERVQARLADRYVGTAETTDGLELRFEGADETLVAVARFAADELQCCSFADYEIAVSPPYERTRLRLRGPEGTRSLFREGLVDRLERGAVGDAGGVATAGESESAATGADGSS